MVDLRQDKLLDTRGASRLLGLSEDTMKAWRSRKKGPPYVMVEGAVRYLLTDLEDYLESNVHRPAG